VPVEPRKTARQNLGDIGRLYDVDVQELEDRIPDLLSFVGLSGTGGDRVATFSKGMRQRLGIARSLLHRPDLLLLDEPFSGLDPAAQRELRGLVETLASEGLALLIATHRLAEAAQICDRVGILHAGRLRQEIPFEEDLARESIHADFLDPPGEEILAAVNDLDGVGAVEQRNGWARILADDELSVSQVRSILQGRAQLTRYRNPKQELEGLYDRFTTEGSDA
jgi:ABC-type multidrug transport system ATPase subunit